MCLQKLKLKKLLQTYVLYDMLFPDSNETDEVTKMDIIYAKQILQALADGVNPETGEVLPKNDSCNGPEVIRALHRVLQELEKNDKPKKSKWENAGLPWTEEDEQTLCTMFDRGDSNREICKHLRRSERGIAARLVKLGKISYRDEFEYGRK